MTTKSFFPLLLAGAALFISCKKELEPQESSDAKPTVTPAAAAPVSPAATQQMQPQVLQAPAQAQPVAAKPAPVQKTAPGMNPPHGQPNHRCDIAVGAPLNSPPGQKAPITQTTNVPQGKASVQPTVNTNSPAVVTETAPGMNPPHGQPGHSCAVAVGAPLPKT